MPITAPPPVDWVEAAPVSTAYTSVDRVRVRVGAHFGGFSSGPGSLVGAFVGWQSLYLAGDVGIFERDDWGLRVGGAFRSGRPFLAETLLSGLVGLVGGETDWRARDTGFNARLSAVRYGKKVEKSVTLLAGMSQWSVDGSAVIANSTVSGLATSGGARFGVAGGLTRALSEHLSFTSELQYTAGRRFRKQQAITYTNANGEEETLFALTGVMKPPRGFSWVFALGYSF